jgi:hypothetical protein
MRFRELMLTLLFLLALKLIRASRPSQPGASPSQTSPQPSAPSMVGPGPKHVGVGLIVGVAVSFHALNSRTNENVTNTPFVGWGCLYTTRVSWFSLLLSTAATAARHGVRLFIGLDLEEHAVLSTLPSPASRRALQLNVVHYQPVMSPQGHVSL